MRNWINLLNEYADPDKRADGTFYQGAAHRAHKSIWERTGFKEWFKGSHVCAPDGEPLVAFHGSYEDFAEFKHASERRRSYGFNRLGFWFDIDPRTPETFAGYSGGEIPKGSVGGIMPCVLSIKRPYFLDSEFIYTPDIDELRTAFEHMKQQGELHQSAKRDDLGNLRLPDGTYIDPRVYHDARNNYDRIRARILAYDSEHSNRIDGFTELMKRLPHGAKSKDAEVDAFKNELIADGYDGIYIGDTAADFGTRDFAGTDWWIAFHPNQIKSVFAQSFSAGSNNIME